MDFTREPIIETIITPKDGYKLALRSSKGITQEEYFLEAVQIVSYGNAIFYRSTELPKSFLVPVSDYELVEVRETRVALKSAAPDRAIKIGGGRDASLRSAKDQALKEFPTREALRDPLSAELGKEPLREAEAIGLSPLLGSSAALPAAAAAAEPRHDKKRDRRRSTRRRRAEHPDLEEGRTAPATADAAGTQPLFTEKKEFSTSLTSILPPPSHLIADTIHQYRGSELFKDIFHAAEEKSAEAESLPQVDLEQKETAQDPAFLGALFLTPPPSLVHEAMSSSTEQPADEETNQKAFFLEVLSQSPQKAQPVEIKNEAVESQDLRLGERQIEEASFPSLRQEEESKMRMEDDPSSSYWPEVFGGVHQTQHEEEEDRPLPL